MKILGIIPARYQSTRFAGKPLADIAGKTMIQRVYEQVKQALNFVVVATDDKRIFDEVERFGGQVVMTGKHHKSGTERCVEALALYQEKTKQNFDVAINIQGDEPLISPEAIKSLAELFDDSTTEIATLVNEQNFSENLHNPNTVKVIIRKDGSAAYFSRSIIPYVRDKENLLKIKFYKHVGIYGYRSEVLKKIANLPATMSEIAENLEQNRWIENNFTIRVQITEYQSIGVDTPEDLSKILKYFKS